METHIDFKGLRVAVTGGTSGLGLAIVRRLAVRGARVAFVARSASAVERIATETGACGIVGDIGRRDDIYPIALQMTGHLGGLDVLINNASGEPIEVRLAAWLSMRGPIRFVALAFGAGDHRTRTDDRPPPPALLPDDRLSLGPLVAIVERLLGHPQLVALRFLGNRDGILAGLARHGRPIQYAHIPEPLALWDVWTSIAADPMAFEPPSAGFALDRRTLGAWRRRGIGFATLTHAAGLSSTGGPMLDLRLPFDEPYRIPERTAAAINQAKSEGGRIVAIGTTVVRALEFAAGADGNVRAGDGVARGRIVVKTRLRVVDAILTGVHQPGESHFELLRAFADDAMLDHISAAVVKHGYRAHEFGDSVLIERQPRAARQ